MELKDRNEEHNAHPKAITLIRVGQSSVHRYGAFATQPICQNSCLYKFGVCSEIENAALLAFRNDPCFVYPPSFALDVLVQTFTHYLFVSANGTNPIYNTYNIHFRPDIIDSIFALKDIAQDEELFYFYGLPKWGSILRDDIFGKNLSNPGKKASPRAETDYRNLQQALSRFGIEFSPSGLN